MQLSTSTRAALAHDLGPDLHRWSRVVATAVAFTYVAGMAAGELVHWLNDRLAGGRRPWPVRLGSLFDAKPVAVTERIVMNKPALIIDHDGRARFADLAFMPVGELRRIARSQGLSQAGGRAIHLARKQDLVDALWMPIQ
jgi:hypothetical protein